MLEKLNTSNNQNRPWLDIVETASVVGSLGGTIASIVFQQAALASVPLSITVMLNLVNRRMQLESLAKNNQSAIAQIMPSVEANSQQITQVQQLTFDYQQVKSNVKEHSQQLQSHQTAMLQAQSETQGKLDATGAQLTQSGRDFSQLKSDTQDHAEMLQTSQLMIAELLQDKAEVQTTIESLTAQLVEVFKKIGYLREIESSTQAIRIAPYDADIHYKRGLSFQALGDNQGSIGDFTEAIQLNPSHASAYYSRGLSHIDLGNRKRAVEDFREAAKLFFEDGDIASYQMARDSSKQIHNLNSSVSAEANEQGAVGRLFA